MENGKNTIKRTLTELEGAVLGIIGVNGPCTPYFIRKEFKQSPTPYWSGSAGTIYPIIDRLAKQNLISHVSAKNNLRGGKLYTLTKNGEKGLKDWIYQPKSPFVIGSPPDAIRTRIDFLAFLTPNIRKKFLDEIASELETQLEFFENEVNEKSEEHDQFAYFASRGSMLTTQARLTLVRELINSLKKTKS